jgi:GH15 family glucan-1,4-alpha-glucosidase
MAEHNKNKQYLPIEAYGIIGNLQTVALVSRNASIDFMCFPRFDSPSIFCKLLDAEKGGSFSINPNMKDYVMKQLYLPDTNILLTRFFADEGIVEIIDFMPIVDETLQTVLIRKVTTVRGKVEYKMNCSPRFNYAASKADIEKKNNNVVFTPAEKGQPSVELISEQTLHLKGHDAITHFKLNEADSTWFILRQAHTNKALDKDPDKYIKTTYYNTIKFWQKWISQLVYKGHWGEVVRRSALTLKLLICRALGSMVAAPTFSLPEAIGQSRNWDYRYTWIRDAAFSMHAFLELGFLEEAEQFLEWIKKQSSENQLQLMFSLDGGTKIDESCLDYLDGYKGSKPVRIGNDAHKQTQMDIYGELLETIYIFVNHGGDITFDYWKIICKYVELVVENWHQPDHSIWEVRGEKREFLFSRMMCWVALDRAIKIGDHFSYPYDFVKWRQVRNDLYNDIHENFWSEKKQAFVQFKGSDSLDASCLLLPILNVISPHSERWKKTMEALDRELRSDVLIYRYKEQNVEIDGLKGKEGTFTMCSFWHIECLELQGETEKAKEHFEKMLGYANHLGLYAEQIGLKGEQLGNFPQAFTHLSLISAAIELSSSKKAKAPHMRNYTTDKK